MENGLINILSGLQNHPSLVLELIQLCEKNEDFKEKIMNKIFFDSLPILLHSEYFKETIILLVNLSETFVHDYFYEKKFLFFVVDKIYENVLLLIEEIKEEDNESIDSYNNSISTMKEYNENSNKPNKEENNSLKDLLNNSENSAEKEFLENYSNSSLHIKKVNHSLLINLLKLTRNLIKNDKRDIICTLLYNLGYFFLINNLDFPIVEEIYNLIFNNLLNVNENLTRSNKNYIKEEGILEYQRKYFGSKVILKNKPLVVRSKLNYNYRGGSKIHLNLITSTSILYRNVLIYALTVKNDHENVNKLCESFIREKFINNLLEDESNLRILLIIFYIIYKEKRISLFLSINLNLFSKFKNKSTELIDLIYLVNLLSKDYKGEHALNIFFNENEYVFLFDYLKYDTFTVVEGSFTDRVLYLLNDCFDSFDKKYFNKISHLIILSTINHEISHKISKSIIDYLKEDPLNLGRILFTIKEKKKKCKKSSGKRIPENFDSFKKESKIINENEFTLQEDFSEEEFFKSEENNFDIYNTNDNQ